MKFIFTFIFAALFLFAEAQKKSLSHYYFLINSAERFIIEGKLDSASICFKKGFQKINHPFSRHIYNAAVVESKLGNNKNVSHYLKRIVELGASFYKIWNQDIFLSFFSSNEGKAFIKNYKNFKPVFSQEYRKKIELMLEDDQSFRVKKGSYNIYGDTILKIDKKNIEKFLSLTKLYGFPSEYKIGLDTSNFSNPLYIPIVIHQSSGSMQQYDFTNILKKNVLEGNIENKAGDFMINRSTGNNFYQIVKAQYVKPIDSTISVANPHNIIILDSSDWGYFPLSKKEADVINSRRQELYLENYEESLLKALFSLKNKDYLLSSSGANSILNYINYLEFIDIKQKIKLSNNQ